MVFYEFSKNINKGMYSTFVHVLSKSAPNFINIYMNPDMGIATEDNMKNLYDMCDGPSELLSRSILYFDLHGCNAGSTFYFLRTVARKKLRERGEINLVIGKGNHSQEKGKESEVLLEVNKFITKYGLKYQYVKNNLGRMRVYI
jgi:hypothetical protein